jgi:D-threonate/D-erythronate kinase
MAAVKYLARRVCTVIADDLTGACDAGLQFVNAGFATDVWLSAPGKCDSEVMVLDTNTRQMPTDGDAVQAVQRAFEQAAGSVVFKKIDSTLKGHVAAELAAALAARPHAAVILTPAYPEMGRTVVDGQLRIRGEVARDVIGTLGVPAVHVGTRNVTERICAGLARGARVFAADAVTRDDLRAVGDALRAMNHEFVWVGSAGLAQELARHMGAKRSLTVAARLAVKSVLVVVGSTNSVTERQVQQLRDGDAQIVRVQRGRAVELKADVGGIIVCGGDTARLLCETIAATHIRLGGEVATGIPWGIIRSGQFAGVPIVTKAGGFGEPDALVAAVRFLRQ